MKKRIISLVLSMMILVSSMVSATAAIDTTGLTQVQAPLAPMYFTGDTGSIMGGIFTADQESVTFDADGNKITTRTKGGDRYIQSKIVYDLGDRFEFKFETASDNQNPNSNNRIVYQLGDLAIAYFSYGSGTGDNHGIVRVYYGTDIASIGGSGISYNTTSNYLVAESTDIGINKRYITIGFDNATLDILVTDEENNSLFETTATIADYDFSAIAPAIRVYKRSSVWSNGLYTQISAINALMNGAILSERIAAFDPATVTYDDIAGINVLGQWYNGLDTTEQGNITNVETLNALSARVPVLIADNLNTIIGKIAVNELKLSDRLTIEGYRAEYETYTEDQKLLVTNLANLEAAEAEILRLTILKNDTEAANVVNAEILAMGEIDYSNYLYVSDARKSYETLTEQGKSLVKDYKVLTTAEATVKALRKATSFRMVNELIEAIPDEVTMANNDAVFNALGAYSMLSTAEKRLVNGVNELIDKANTLIKSEVANNELISPKIVTLVQLGKSYGSGYPAALPDDETGLYFGVDRNVTIYKGDTVKPGVYWTNLIYDIIYDDTGAIVDSKNSNTVYNITTGGSNWWGNNFQPLSNGAVRNASVGTLNLYHTNIGIHIASCEVKERPTYEYNELFNVAMNVRTMIAALPKEYSKLTENDRYIVDSTNEAIDTLSVYDLDEVHEVRYLINSEKVLNGAVIDDEINNTESNINGDITKDFVINSLDLLTIQMHILNLAPVIDSDRCDVNNDGRVDSADLVAIQMYIVGLGTL